MDKMPCAFFLLAVSSVASALPQCPPLGSVNFLIPHETDCSKFYICAHGTPLLQTCPDGTHFNPNFMVCQNPVFARCEPSPPDSELPCSWPDFIVHRPHPDSCGKYYVCEFGTAIVFNCPDGLEFNAQLQECVWPHESNCISQESGCLSGVLSQHAECSKYYICDNGVNVAMDCPNGLQWSSKIEQCVWPHDSDCSIQDGDHSDAAQDGAHSAAAQDGAHSDAAQDGAHADAAQNGDEQDVCVDGTLSTHKDCRKYNMCSHGVNVPMDCPAGLHWNSKLSLCDWPGAAGCK